MERSDQQKYPTWRFTLPSIVVAFFITILIWSIGYNFFAPIFRMAKDMFDKGLSPEAAGVMVFFMIIVCVLLLIGILAVMAVIGLIFITTSSVIYLFSLSASSFSRTRVEYWNSKIIIALLIVGGIGALFMDDVWSIMSGVRWIDKLLIVSPEQESSNLVKLFPIILTINGFSALQLSIFFRKNF